MKLTDTSEPVPTLSLDPPPAERGIGTKIVWNTVSGVLRIIVVAPVPFLLTPFLLRHVGTAGFGIWAVLLSLNGLTALADLGFVGTLTKHVSEHHAHRDHVSVSRVINSGLVMFAIIALAVCLIVNGATA